MLSNLFEKLFNVQEATSHCDIPCGIYDPRDAIQAAQTVVRMTELLEELEDGEITFYKQGEFTDLCKGPHIPHTGHIKALKLLKTAGA